MRQGCGVIEKINAGKIETVCPRIDRPCEIETNSFVTVPEDSQLTCNGQTINISITILSCALSFHAQPIRSRGTLGTVTCSQRLVCSADTLGKMANCVAVYVLFRYSILRHIFNIQDIFFSVIFFYKYFHKIYFSFLLL